MSGDFSYLSVFFLTDKFFLKCYHPDMAKVKENPLQSRLNLVFETEEVSERVRVIAGAIIFPKKRKHGKVGFKVKSEFLAKHILIPSEEKSRLELVSDEPVTLFWSRDAGIKGEVGDTFIRERGLYFYVARESVLPIEREQATAGNGKQ